MTKVVTTAQMRALEEAAGAAGVSERQLMFEAGVATAQEAWMAVGAMESRPILVLVGPGNNGGDALIAATQLLEWGGATHAYLLRARGDDDAVWQASLAAGLQATTHDDDPDFSAFESLLSQASLVIDGLLGTGQRPRERPIAGDLAGVMTRLRDARNSRFAPPQLIAIDVPTGVDADTGYADPLAVAVDITVALGFTKVGLLAAPGHALAGRIVPVEIGLPRDAGDGLPYEELRMRDLRALMPARPDDAHKGTFGTVMVVAGSKRYPGAARLAAEAAARSGAGLTALAAPEAIQPLLVHGLPDAVHEPLPSTEGALDEAAAIALLRALATSRTRALVVGPGIGTAEYTGAFMRALVAGLDAASGLEAVVLDADALNLLAREPRWWERFPLPRVLTPHAGEMARLSGRDADDVQANRLAVATAYAAESGSVVVLKGACTIVAAPDGRARISPIANAMLAHAGTGDVLAGLIGGLLAQGMGPFDAASAAVWVHAEAGRLVAGAYGTAAGIAQDLLRALPDARKLLEEPTFTAAGGLPFGGPGGGMGGVPGMGGMGGMGGPGEPGGLPGVGSPFGGRGGGPGGPF
ncbi:MAG: NAD(P)H-hydrate dehydratase [Dehalococcoidia bacterium]